MIDTDEYIEMWNDHLLGSEGVQDLMNALIAEVKRLQKEVDLLSIDVCESLELILDAHHPEVKNSVMSMFGDAIGDNWPYYGTPLPNKEMIK